MKENEFDDILDTDVDEQEILAIGDDDLDVDEVDEDDLEPEAGNQPAKKQVETGVKASTITISVDGKPYKVQVEVDENGEIAGDVEMPEGLTEKQQAQFKNKVSNYQGGLVKQQKDRMEMKKRLDEQAEINRKLLAKLNESDKPKGDSDKSIEMQVFGTEDWTEIDDLKLTDKKAYNEGMRLYHQKLAEKQAEGIKGQTKAEMEQQMVVNQIIGDGVDPKAVQAFMKANAIGTLSSAYNLYLVQHPLKSTQRRRETPAELQARTPKFVPPGTIAAKAEKKKELTPGQKFVEKQRQALENGY